MAWNLTDTFETSNNQDAESILRTDRDRGGVLTDKFNAAENPDFVAGQNDPEEEGDEPLGPPPSAVPPDAQLMKLFKSALQQGTQYQEQMQKRWARAYRAWNNEHEPDSKYNQPRYRGRSRNFRPKTRATVRKKQAEAAAALFSSQDAIIVGPANPADQGQEASAAILKELVNFRLDRSNENSGIPWFLIAMGAHQTAQLTGICCSKQYWEYKETITGYEPQVAELTHPLTGEVMMSFETGELDYSKPIKKVVRDRPRVRLFEPEEVIRDPAAAWEDQAQDSSYLILRYPMTVNDAKNFIASQQGTSRVQFRKVDPRTIENAAGTDANTGGLTNGAVRRARSSDGQDRYSDTSIDKTYQIVWLNEVFMRFDDGDDYVFWTLDTKGIISNPVKVEEAYPEQGGARPVTIGVTTLEPFKIDPMSPVESWQQIQWEINDAVNLRLDTAKQTVAPLAIVKRGRSIDIKAIQNRTTDSHVFVQDKDDLTFDRPGDVGQALYVEVEKMNADFDDLAGNFSLGSVQTNRQLGETVGGMQMMTSNANAMGEFDLRVWIETWAEPVLRQIVKLEQYYESDENVLAIAGNKAQLLERFNGDPDWEWLLNQQVTLTCNVGLGAADPMMSLNKFSMAAQNVGQILAGPLGAAAKANEIVDEVFGKAGYKSAAERFFDFEGADPKSQMMQQQMQEMGMQLEDLTQQLQQAKLELANKSGQIASQENIAKLQAFADLLKQKLTVTGNLAKTEMEHEHQSEQAQMQQDFQTQQQFDQLAAEMGKAEHQHELGMEQDDAARQFQAEQSDQDRQFQSEQVAPRPPAGGAANDMAAMLGLQQPDMTPLVQTMMQGFQMIAAQIADGQKQTAQIIAAVSQRQTQAITQGNERVVQAITAPKRIIRDENGFMAGAVTQPQQAGA